MDEVTKERRRGRDMASGSNSRKRTKQCLVRFTDEEFAAVSAKADRAGYTLAAILREAALGTPGPRARRRPPIDHQALRQLLGECNRIGNNVNQIARHLNTTGEADIREVQDALAAYLDIRNAILAALGMTTEATPDDYQGRQPQRA